MQQNQPFNQQSPQMYFQQLLAMGNNPQQILQVLVQRNPQMQSILNQMQYLQQSGLTMEQYIMQLAMQRNIPITQDFLNQTTNQLKGMIPK